MTEQHVQEDLGGMGLWEHFTVHDGLPDMKITCLLADHQDQLWIGTFGRGVARFDGDRFRTFTTEDGLPSNTVLGITQDREGRIWVATDSGLAWFDDFVFRTVGPELGMPPRPVTRLVPDAPDGVLAVVHNRLLRGGRGCSLRETGFCGQVDEQQVAGGRRAEDAHLLCRLFTFSRQGRERPPCPRSVFCRAKGAVRRDEDRQVSVYLCSAAPPESLFPKEEQVGGDPRTRGCRYTSRYR